MLGGTEPRYPLGISEKSGFGGVSSLARLLVGCGACSRGGGLNVGGYARPQSRDRSAGSAFRLLRQRSKRTREWRVKTGARRAAVAASPHAASSAAAQCAGDRAEYLVSPSEAPGGLDDGAALGGVLVGDQVANLGECGQQGRERGEVGRHARGGGQKPPGAARSRRKARRGLSVK